MTTNFHNEYGIINKILRTHDDGAKLINGKTNEREAYDVSRSRKDVVEFDAFRCAVVSKRSNLIENRRMVYLCKFFLLSSRRLVKTYLPKKKEEDDYQ